jgi:predicted phage terminase large subunit-like protein
LKTRSPLKQKILKGFIATVNPRFNFYQHCELLADVLERVASGEIKRLLVQLPPRHSKSELVSRLFSAYYLTKNPSHFVGINSYSAELAYTLSRASRENYQRFGGVVKSDAAAVKHWENYDGGGVWAAGVGGSITGKGGNLLLIDDPLKNSEEAASEVIREKQKEWYSSTFYTRAEPDAAIVIIQCMTGDTPVLMSDGTEKPLSNIQVGDTVATYDNGRISTSKVKNWKNQGSDYIFAIRTKSGKIVRANERHPFLVYREGRTEWIRLRNLKIGDKIIQVMQNGGNTKELNVSLKGAINSPNAKDIVCPITIKHGGQADIARRQLIQNQDVRLTYDTDTALTLTNTNQCSKLKTENVPYVSNRLPQTFAPIGAENSALTTTTSQARLEDYYATTVISQSDTVKQKKFYSKPLNTCEIIQDEIVEITESGCEDVFDIQVENTENFIANGLVSHNTRWHEEDLTGWLLSEEIGDTPEGWTVVCLPALYEEVSGFPVSCDIVPDFRYEIGEALCPERYDEIRLAQIRSRIGEYHFDALYQQTPTSKTGSFFDVSQLKIVDAAPAVAQRFRGWDKAATEGDGDYTVGVKISKADNNNFYIENVVRGQFGTAKRDATIRQITELDGKTVKVIGEQEPGSGGKESAENFIRLLSGFTVQTERVTGTKELRADPFSSQVNAGNVKIVRGDWNKSYIDELRTFPRGRHDDQVDASSLAFNAANKPAKTSGISETDYWV